MAFWARMIVNHAKCWHSVRQLVVNNSTPICGRPLCTLVADSGALVQEAGITQEGRVAKNEPKTFEELFKKSTFVALGNPKGKIVVGTVKKVVERNVYIDFGWKFPCVCTLPFRGSGAYVPGRKVRICIKELEMASKFLGSRTELSLNEADCVLLGLFSGNKLAVDDIDEMSEEASSCPSWDMVVPLETNHQSESVEELIISLRKNQKSSQETIEESTSEAAPTKPRKGDT